VLIFLFRAVTSPFLFTRFLESVLISFLKKKKEYNQLPISSPLHYTVTKIMPHIMNDPMQAICPSFEDPEWEFLRQSAVNAHQGDQPLTLDEAAQQMKDAWSCENQCKITAWDDQLLQDQVECYDTYLNFPLFLLSSSRDLN
jgi:hypothetical protein